MKAQRGADDWRAGECGAAKLVANFGFGFVGVADVDLGKNNDSASHAEIFKNLKMLFGLRHPTVIGGDDEQGEVD